MKQPSMPQRRKHIYVYALLVLGAVAMGNIKISKPEPSAVPISRATAANQMANTLFQ
jgi:hypothetical protein